MGRMKSYNLLLGTSGTGKGTRLSQLLTFLDTKFDSAAIHVMQKGRQRQLGIHFRGIDVFVIGQWTISNKSGLKSWSSLDYINSMTGKTDLTIEMVKTETFGHVIGEGEPMLLSNKYRPTFMHEMYEIDKMSFHVYNYETREQYDERILGRSGKIAGEGGWSRNESYNKVVPKCQEEVDALDGIDFLAHKSPHDASLTEFGENFLRFINHEELIEDFLKWSEKHQTLRNIKTTPKAEKEPPPPKPSQFDEWM